MTTQAKKAVITQEEKDLALTEVTKLYEEAETTRKRCVAGSDARIRYERICFALGKAVEILESVEAA